MIEPRLEEQAALAALGWSDDPAGLERVAEQEIEVADTIRSYADVAAFLAYDVPQHAPPHILRARILEAIGGGKEPATARVAKPWRLADLFRLPSQPMMPYALAACLMGLALLQAGLILLIDSRLDSLRSVHRDPLAGVQLVDLKPQGDHGDAKLMVAWNAKMCCGMLSMDKMPDPPAGSDYQLWVLDPSKSAPVSAGIVPRGATSQHFVAGEVHVPGRPGFAVSLEPAGGRPEPTGQILFAVAPSP